MAARRERCNVCNTVLSVPMQAATIRCPACNTILVFSAARFPAGGGGGVMNQNSVWHNQQQAAFPIMPAANLNPWYQPQLQLQQALTPPPVFGRKRAVLCGINYYGQQKSLKGSVNDVRNMKYLLEKLGFPSASIYLLSDEERNPDLIPTKMNIRKALNWLVQGCQSGDSLVFHYSGHGSQVDDFDGDEIDGFDEALVPVDYNTEGKIIDDEINATIVRPLPPRAKLHAIIDTCRSGTLLDLPFMCRVKGGGFYMWEDHRVSRVFKGTRGGRAVCFSACDDDQTSGDTTAFTGIPSGAMTNSFIQSVEIEQNLTYGRLLMGMRNRISATRKALQSDDPNAASNPTEAQLSSSERFDIHSEVFSL